MLVLGVIALVVLPLLALCEIVSCASTKSPPGAEHARRQRTPWDGPAHGRLRRAGRALWAADGMPTGTRLLVDFSSAWQTSPPVPLGRSVVFLVRLPGSGAELWRSDGTVSGTSIVKSIPSRHDPQCSSGPHRLGRAVVFLADDGSTGCNVWRSDGTADGTVPLGVVGAGSSAMMIVVGSARGFLVFTDFTDLWRTDGTPEGTFLLRSFPAEALAKAPGAGTHEGVYFAVQTNGQPDTTQQLWMTDGSVAGTVLLHDFKAGSEDSTIRSLTTANGRLLASIVGTVPPPPLRAPRRASGRATGRQREP